MDTRFNMDNGNSSSSEAISKLNQVDSFKGLENLMFLWLISHRIKVCKCWANDIKCLDEQQVISLILCLQIIILYG